LAKNKDLKNNISKQANPKLPLPGNPETDAAAREARRRVQIQCQDTGIAATAPSATAEEATQARVVTVTEYLPYVLGTIPSTRTG